MSTPEIQAAAVPAIQRLYWTIRRELWESRSIYIAPVAVAAVYLLGFLVGVFHLPQTMRAAAALEPMHQRAAVSWWFDGLAGLNMAVLMIIGAVYCTDALYGERRDRSILFWKSLPVSDLMTVLAKACIPIFIMPVLTFAITFVAQLFMLVVSSAVLAGNGMSAAALWSELSFPRMSVYLLYHLVTVHSLWIAPIYGWLLFVSAASRRAPYVWAFVPPVALCFLEKILFNTTHIAGWFGERLSGNGMDALTVNGTFPTHPMTHLTPWRFLGSAGLWIGFAVFAGFVAVAVRLRKARGPA